MYNGIGSSLSDIFRLSDAQSRSISPENLTGEKAGGATLEVEDGTAAHAARDLGKGWKVNPFMRIPEESTMVIADIEGPGCIQSIWMTPSRSWRNLILRIYWDGEKEPSVECPIGDFFACGWDQYAQVNSIPICVNPGSALNSYWQMPFRKRCKITIENRNSKYNVIYYQINYCLTDIPDDAAYFHAQFRRVNPQPYKEVFTILDGVKGKGHYVGTYMCWGCNNTGWWGEGEIKFYIDEDEEYPTICGTGLEDYFGGSYNFESPKTGTYEEYSTPYMGMPQVIRPDNAYKSQLRFGLYRWHLPDPIRFEKELKVTIQALGWRSEGRYLPLQDDISSVAIWYQTLPHGEFPELPDKDYLEII
ncbi:MAG: DUF2961 domain-containing protein [Clostridiales bacterium]|nr:DUF2961 domain-containing protein [Clostridiales bacterium]